MDLAIQKSQGLGPNKDPAKVRECITYYTVPNLLTLYSYTVHLWRRETTKQNIIFYNGGEWKIKPIYSVWSDSTF